MTTPRPISRLQPHERLWIRDITLIDDRGTLPHHHIVIEHGQISGFAAPDTTENTHIIDGTGHVLAPAFIDPHAHLREPGQTHKEDLESGLSAALAGGFGTVVCMPNTQPVLDTPEVIEALCNRAKTLQLARLLPSAALTMGQRGEHLTEAAALKAQGVVMLTDDGRTNEHSGVLRRALEYSSALGMVVSVHAEDAGLRGDGVMNEGAVSERLGLPGNPIAAEAARIARDIEILATSGGRLHVQHLSSARGLALVRQAKAQGLGISCEVTPHHLTLDDELFASQRFFCNPVLKVAPPLRTQSDVAALIAGVLDGTIDCIGTDHAPHSLAEKQQDMLHAPFGIANIELTFPLLYTRFVATGQWPLELLIGLLTTGPAQLLNLPAPRLDIGTVADVVLLDITTERPVVGENLRTKAKLNPWEGEALCGWPALTVVEGRAFDVRSI
jgi:dihydroorotase